MARCSGAHVSELEMCAEETEKLSSNNNKACEWSICRKRVCNPHAAREMVYSVNKRGKARNPLRHAVAGQRVKTRKLTKTGPFESSCRYLS